jgi:DNA ligase-4
MKLHNSMYVCADRTESWVKLKPEYMDGVSDTLDVVIIGGYYGEGEVRVVEGLSTPHPRV